MKIVDQVTSLELARKLEEAGYPQEGLWWWHQYPDEKEFIYRGERYIDADLGDFVAPTVAELGEALPDSIYSCKEIDNTWFGFYDGGDDLFKLDEFVDFTKGSKTEADARALMWLKLKENQIKYILN